MIADAVFFGDDVALSLFLVIMTNFILLIGAGLFCKAVGDFQENAFNNLSVTHSLNKHALST